MQDQMAAANLQKNPPSSSSSPFPFPGSSSPFSCNSRSKPSSTSFCCSQPRKQGRITITNNRSIWRNNPNKGKELFLPKYGNNPKLMEIAQSLEACEATEEAVAGVLGEEQLNAKGAVFIINNLQSWQKAHLAFKYFKSKASEGGGFEMKSILYNVTMKVLRKGRQLDLVEEMAEQMVREGIRPDNFTFSTVISCARACKLPHKAAQWFERMMDCGCVPNEVTFSAMVDAYGKAGKISEALPLYVKARPHGWGVDALTFSTLLKTYAVSGNYGRVLNTYEEMKTCGVKPNLVIFNTMLDAMGRAGRPGKVKSLQKEMFDAGFLPNGITFSALIRGYARARWHHDAFEWFRRMKEAGWELDTVIYNTLLNMCAAVGMVDDAITIWNEMLESHNCKPDVWSYDSMISIYGKMGCVDEAEEMLNEVVARSKPSVFAFISVIQSFGKLKRFDDVVRIFDRLLEVGFCPSNHRVCGCLLSVLSLCAREEFGKVVTCVERADPRLATVVKSLVADEGIVDIKNVMQDIESIFDESPEEVRKPFLNCLIDLCWNFGFPDRARNLLEMGTSFQIYRGLQSKSPTEWCLNLRTLSLGAALVAFQEWVNDLTKSIDSGEELPPVIGIYTGHGKQKLSGKTLAATVESYLKEIGAPFYESPKKPGLFLITQEAITSWLECRNFSSLNIASISN